MPPPLTSLIPFAGVYGGLETHVPIPNTIDKGPSDDGTVYLTMGG